MNRTLNKCAGCGRIVLAGMRVPLKAARPGEVIDPPCPRDGKCAPEAEAQEGALRELETLRARPGERGRCRNGAEHQWATDCSYGPPFCRNCGVGKGSEE